MCLLFPIIVLAKWKQTTSKMPAQERPRSYSSDLSTSSPNFFRVPVPLAATFTPTENLSSLESDDLYAAVAVPILITYHPIPIPIPREPTLEEMIQEASGTTELAQVKQLKLGVISDNHSLQRIATFCPLLTSLNLEGSALNTMRELGCLMTCLRHLDVSRCGLRTLDGTSGLGSVTHLVANNNQIEYLDPCAFLDELEELSVQGNTIRTTYNLSCLSQCPLRTLHINGNPIENVENFQEIAKRIIPSLIFLNGQRVREEEEEEDVASRCNEESESTNHTGTSSSSGSGSFSSIEKSLDSFNLSATRDSASDRSNVSPGGTSTTDTGRPISAGITLSYLACISSSVYVAGDAIWPTHIYLINFRCIARIAQGQAVICESAGPARETPINGL